ncbi:MAG: Asp23/Gls24 family envelope stress response protein [Clostridia bacterium]|nr:Asp23/Gls24 family envelope stress response protein [Clostridia bacterium]MBP5272819.1 Asp23/Gls24 family envelope stress response protein [Clostridia bacterium]MBP5459742.1 Asp23/Gls24 family envelope stress response protein [Clostridia bacterium]
MPTNSNGHFSSEYIISEEVLATIAANAAKDVEGVARLGNRPADLYTTFKIGADASKKVAVTMTDYDIRVHVYIDLVSTAKIQPVCKAVQDAVKQAIQNMTGRVVTRVDVSVTGIADPPEPAALPTMPGELEP